MLDWALQHLAATAFVEGLACRGRRNGGSCTRWERHSRGRARACGKGGRLRQQWGKRGRAACKQLGGAAGEVHAEAMRGGARRWRHASPVEEGPIREEAVIAVVTDQVHRVLNLPSTAQRSGAQRSAVCLLNKSCEWRLCPSPSPRPAARAKPRLRFLPADPAPQSAPSITLSLRTRIAPYAPHSLNILCQPNTPSPESARVGQPPHLPFHHPGAQVGVAAGIHPVKTQVRPV